MQSTLSFGPPGLPKIKLTHHVLAPHKFTVLHKPKFNIHSTVAHRWLEKPIMWERSQWIWFCAKNHFNEIITTIDLGAFNGPFYKIQLNGDV